MTDTKKKNKTEEAPKLIQPLRRGAEAHLLCARLAQEGIAIGYGAQIVITVVVLINGNPVFTRSAVNTGASDDMGRTVYSVDDGSELLHPRSAGAVPLAIELLRTIKEPGR